MSTGVLCKKNNKQNYVLGLLSQCIRILFALAEEYGSGGVKIYGALVR